MHRSVKRFALILSHFYIEACFSPESNSCAGDGVLHGAAVQL
jgi:hypothetical protein